LTYGVGPRLRHQASPHRGEFTMGDEMPQGRGNDKNVAVFVTNVRRDAASDLV
jgi:hypothetical protein